MTNPPPFLFEDEEEEENEDDDDDDDDDDVIDDPELYSSFMTGFKAFDRCCHARVEHKRQSVLPVPVGDSNSALPPIFNACMLFSRNFIWQSYGSFGNSTSTSRITNLGIFLINTSIVL